MSTVLEDRPTARALTELEARRFGLQLNDVWWVRTLSEPEISAPRKLAALTYLGGQAAQLAGNLEERPESGMLLDQVLQDLAIGAVMWAELLCAGAEEVKEALLVERARQDREYASNRELTPAEWCAVLAEELGEVAKEVVETRFHGASGVFLFPELIQSAAVALFWLETVAGWLP